MLQSLTRTARMCQGILVPLVPTVFPFIIKIFFGPYLSKKCAKMSFAENAVGSCNDICEELGESEAYEPALWL